MDVIGMATSQRNATRRFLLAALLLAFMAVFMKPAARSAAATLQKRPVPIRKPLARFDRSALPGFRFTADEGAKATNDVGTKEFFEWRLTPETSELQQLRASILQVYFYTERGSTPVVPHTPELCARQQGDHVVDMGEYSIPAPAGVAEAAIPVKYVRMIQSTQGTSLDLLTVYSFCVNGEFVADREWARLKMAMPWRRALYFAKVQCVVLIPNPDDFDIARQAATQLLSLAIQELVSQHFPTESDLLSAQ